MFCKHCHYEFYVPGDTLGAKIRCPNCTGTLKVEERQFICSCSECGGMLDVALWMIGSVSRCPHCQNEIVLSLGEDSVKYFPGSPKQTAMLKTASKKAGDIIGKYRVIRCLGIGGMGEVYLVEHTLLNTRCALKLLKKDVAKEDPEMRQRMLREARLASRIQHPNLIAVLDAELDEKSAECYIVMEYVDGVSIESIIADAPMLEQRAIEIVVQVSEALKVASAAGIIHRDIKPANIMLSRTGEVKLADLGIAKVESDNKINMTLTMDHAVLGTPNYASPEQLRSSHQVDCRADIYSLGATLYHMLTGVRPFEAESVFGVMANVLEKELPKAHEINPAISEKTSLLIAGMMAKKRDERPADFDVLLKELKSGRKSIFKGSVFKFLKKNNLFRWIKIRSLLLALFAVIGLGIAMKILGGAKLSDLPLGEIGGGAIGYGGVINSGSGRPRSRIFGLVSRRDPAELKREAADLVSVFDRSNINNLKVNDFSNANLLISNIYYYDSNAAEIRQLERAIIGVFPEFFRHLSGVENDVDSLKALFFAVSSIESAALDSTWNSFINVVRQGYLESLASDDESKVRASYADMLTLVPDNPYQNSLVNYKQFQDFLRYGNLIEAKKYLEKCAMHKDIHAELNKKLGAYISARLTRLKHFISYAMGRRDYFAAAKLLDEQTALGKALPELQKRLKSGELNTVPENELNSLVYLSECGNVWAAGELINPEKKVNVKVIDQVVMHLLRELKNNNSKYIVPEVVAVISTFVDAGYRPDAVVIAEMNGNPVFSHLKIEVRPADADGLKKSDKMPVSQVGGKTPAAPVVVPPVSEPVAPKTPETPADSGTVKEQPVPQDNSKKSLPPAASTEKEETAPAENDSAAPESKEKREHKAEKISIDQLDAVRLRIVLADALYNCNIRRLKYFVKHSPELSIDAKKCLNFVREFMRQDYFRAKSICDDFDGSPQLKGIMERHLLTFKQLLSWTIYSYSRGRR